VDLLSGHVVYIIIILLADLSELESDVCECISLC